MIQVLCFGVSFSLCCTIVGLSQQPSVVAHSSGPLVGAPAGISVATGTLLPLPGADLRAEVLRKQPGFSTLPPELWTTPPPAGPLPPDFSAIKLWRGHASPACNPAGAVPDLDAISIGFDWVAATPAGVVFVLPGNWAAMTFSVTPGTAGATGGAIASEAGAADGAAGDVFSYVFPGSALPPFMVDVTERASDSHEIRLDATTPRPDLDGLDHFIALYDLLPLLGIPLPPAPTLYFSVSSATLALVPTAWWLKGAAPTTPSGATILRTTWDPLSGRWSCPTVWHSYDEFGLTAADDLDALAVDEPQGFMLFSLRLPSPRNQILFANLNADAISVSDYRFESGVRVSDRIGIGIGPGDADAICALDPGAQPFLQRAFGIRGAPFSPTLPRAESAAYRRRQGNQDLLQTLSLGGPRPGPSLLFFAPPGGPPNLWFNPVILPSGSGSTWQGDPTLVQFPIQPQWFGLQFDFNWVELNATFTSFALGDPVRVRL